MNTYLIYDGTRWALVRAESANKAGEIAREQVALDGITLNAECDAAIAAGQTLGDHEFLGYLREGRNVRLVHCRVLVEDVGTLENKLMADWCLDFRTDASIPVRLTSSWKLGDDLPDYLPGGALNGEWLFKEFISRTPHKSDWAFTPDSTRSTWDQLAKYLVSRGLK